jgi:hypothetical protein
MNFFVSLSFAAMFTAYFIHFHFANPGFSLEIRLVERIRPAKLEAIFLSTLSVNRIASRVLVGVGRHSTVATQKTLHAPCRPRKSAVKERPDGVGTHMAAPGGDRLPGPAAG